MKALFYLLDGQTNASSWHRALQYFPLLRAAGIEPTASFPVPTGIYERLVEHGAGQRGKLAFYGTFALRRLLHVLRARSWDVVVIQRDLFPFGPPLLERLLRASRVPLVYDTDDATYLRPDFTPDTVFQRFRSFEKVAQVVQGAAWVSVATEPIAAWARTYNARVSVIPMAVDQRLYDRARRSSPREHARSRPVLGWAGTAGGLRYLESLAPALRSIHSRSPFQLRVISGGYRDVRLPGIDVDARPWRAESALADMADVDVGLVPLFDSEFERAKFPFKLLQFMALGIPVVASRVGTAAELLEDERTGLLADADEWESQLDRLLCDPALRARLGQKGWEAVAGRFTVERVGPVFAAGIAGAARGTPAGS